MKAKYEWYENGNMKSIEVSGFFLVIDGNLIYPAKKDKKQKG